MENDITLVPLLFLLFSLLAGALLKLLLKRSNFPYTVGLFCLGLLVGTLCRLNIFSGSQMLQEAVSSAGNIDPDMLLYLFLPVLIFSAAYELDLHTFRKTFVNASIMAVPGVLLSMALAAVMMMGIAATVPGYGGWDWRYALMFGALISATDPVAVVALLKELNTSKRFSTLVDAESLLNDGTGIVLFMLFFATVSGAQPLTGSPVEEFLVVAAGGALLGYIMAVLCIFFVTRFRGDEMVQNSVIILAAYVTFLLAQASLHLSGVIALVAFGLEMTYRGKLLFSPKANEFTEKFWDLASFIANTVIFIIVGIIISLHIKITFTGLFVILLVYLGVNLIRAAVVFLFYPLMSRSGYGLSRRDAVILSWGGLRGALGLTLALMVSCTTAVPEEIRNQVLLLTAGIVTLTLTVNATTIRRLLKRLGLTEIPVVQSFVDYSIRKRVVDSSTRYYEKLMRRENLAGADWEIVKRYIPKEDERPDISGCSKEELTRTIRMRIYGTEYQLVRQLYADGAISRVTYHRLVNSQERHFDSNGALPLSDRTYIFKLFEERRVVGFINRKCRTIPLFAAFLRKRVIALSDIGRGFLALQRDSAEELAAMRDSEIPEELINEIFPMLEMEIRQNIEKMKEMLSRLSALYPEYYANSLTKKAVRMLLCNQRRTVRTLVEDGVMSKRDGIRMERRIESLSENL